MRLVSQGRMVICFEAAQIPGKSTNSCHSHHKARCGSRLSFCELALQHLTYQGLKPSRKAVGSKWHDESNEPRLIPRDSDPCPAYSKTRGSSNCISLLPSGLQLVCGMLLYTTLRAQISSTVLSSCCARHHSEAQQLVTPASTEQLQQPPAHSAVLVCAA